MRQLLTTRRSTIRISLSPGTNSGFILKHGVGSYPHNSEVDVPLVYADYYFLEALLRYQKLNNSSEK